MQEYEVKRGLPKKVDLKAIFAQQFGAAKEENGWFVGGYGAMPVIKARYEAGVKLQVDTESRSDLAALVAKGDQQAMKTAMDTQKRWNDFLFQATGYDAKARGKKAQDKAKKDAP